MQSPNNMAPQPAKPQIIFITGTDTGVGKTHVCGLLLDFLLQHGHNAGYQKWVSTGGDLSEDLEHVLAHCETKPSAPLDLQVPYRFQTPVSPHLAAELEGRPSVDPTVLQNNCRKMAAFYDILIVEGVGGLLVPLRRDLLLADLVARMNLPTIIVARSGLGTINHTLLTLEAARRRNIQIMGVIFSDTNEEEDEIIVQDNIRTIEEIGETRIFGRLPRLDNSSASQAAFKKNGKKILAAMQNQDDQ